MSAEGTPTESAIGTPTESAIGTPTESAIGTVTAYDDQVGLGEITTADGAVTPFHCVAIADGSRTIDVGAHVSFVPLPKLGRYEAGDIRPH